MRICFGLVLDLCEDGVLDDKHYVEIEQDPYAVNARRKYHLTGGHAKTLVLQAQQKLWERLSGYGTVTLWGEDDIHIMTSDFSRSLASFLCEHVSKHCQCCRGGPVPLQAPQQRMQKVLQCQLQQAQQTPSPP